MLSFAPFGADEPPRRTAALAAPPRPPPGTECNYLVMFFVAGVFLMALVDNIRD
jgi:hypothetical protein